MKTKPKINTSPGHCANLLLAAGATVSTGMKKTSLKVAYQVKGLSKLSRKVEQLKKIVREINELIESITLTRH